MTVAADMQDGLFEPVDDFFARAMLDISGETDPIVAQVLRLVSAAARSGNVCIQVADETVLRRLGTEVQPVAVLEAVWGALRQSQLVGDGSRETPLVMDDSGRVYLHRFWQTQQRLAYRIVEKGVHPQTIVDTANPVERAVALAGQSDFLVITGGPGAGKTTLVATVLASLIALRSDIRMMACAPSGKAAVRLREALARSRVSPHLLSRYPAPVVDRLPVDVSTIHRLLSPVAGTNRFRYSRERQLPVDVLVVDEASMVDLHLMSALFDAVPRRAKVILLGDQYQLSSIEPGRILGDICYGAVIRKLRKDAPFKNETLAECIVTLDGSYRFSPDSGIGQLAAAVNAGDAKLAERLVTDSVSAEIEYVNLRHPDARIKMASLMETLFTPGMQATTAEEKLRCYEASRILCAVNHGPFGVQGLNRMAEVQLENRGFIRPGDAMTHHELSSGLLYGSKPIIIPKNDYSVSLFNGDTGVICQERDRLLACFWGSDGAIRKLPVSALRSHFPAFATTIHKAQGSEFDHVVVVLPETKSPLLSRELLYTAVTRARKKLTIFAAPGVIQHCVSHPTRRAFALGHQLWGVEAEDIDIV